MSSFKNNSVNIGIIVGGLLAILGIGYVGYKKNANDIARRSVVGSFSESIPPYAQPIYRQGEEDEYDDPAERIGGKGKKTKRRKHKKRASKKKVN